MSLLGLFEWCNNTSVGAAIRESAWLFPVVETVHLLALAVLGGTILVVDFRLCGLGLRRQPVAEIAHDVQPWMVGSLATMLVSGALLFSSEALKCYENGAFWMKMISLLLAVLFTFTVRRSATRAGSHLTPAWGRVVAAISLTLWLGVGVGGRAIGFY
jgi:hypothetical protein